MEDGTPTERPALIVVNGLSGSGKSGLAQRLAVDLALPCVGNDQLKEVIFDTLGWSDLAWSERLGVTSSALLWSVCDSIVRAGHSLVIENHFKPDVDAPQLREVQARCRPRIVEIHCYADRDVLVQRVKERIARGDRDPGHGEQDQQTLHGTVIPNLKTDRDPLLDAPDLYILVDTGACDDGETKPPYEALLAEVRDFLTGAHPESPPLTPG